MFCVLAVVFRLLSFMYCISACMYDLAPPSRTTKRGHKSIRHVFAKSYAVIIKHTKQTELGLNVSAHYSYIQAEIQNMKDKRRKSKTRNTKAKTQNIEDKIQKTKVTSLIHKTQNIP